METFFENSGARPKCSRKRNYYSTYLAPQECGARVAQVKRKTLEHVERFEHLERSEHLEHRDSVPAKIGRQQKLGTL